MKAAVATKYFDTLEYVRKAKEIKDPEVWAEYQIRQIESVAEVVAQQAKEDVNHLRDEIFNKSLATKGDVDSVEIALKKDIDLIKTDLSKDIALVRTDLGKEIAAVRMELSKEIAAVKTELRKDIALVRTDFRKDLTIEIERLRHETLKFVVWTGVGVTVTLGSILGTMIARI